MMCTIASRATCLVQVSIKTNNSQQKRVKISSRTEATSAHGRLEETLILLGERRITRARRGHCSISRRAESVKPMDRQ
jgi:hypothetical protein